jgi:hypothetical protein
MPEANEIPKEANDFNRISTDEVLFDLLEAAEDLGVCHKAIEHGITNYSGSESVLERYKGNLQQIEVMVGILKTRH